MPRDCRVLYLVYDRFSLPVCSNAPDCHFGGVPFNLGIEMFANWVLRQVKKSVSVHGRRVSRSVGQICLMEHRVLLAAQIGYSPAVLSPARAPATASQNGPLFPLTETFKLHSLPGATKVIYLDFNGQQVTGTAWNSNGNTLNFEAYSFEGDASFTNNELEQLQRIWARVAEDFAPFNVNVTTEEPPLDDLRNTGGGDTRWGIRALISNNDPLNTGAGGVAYIGSFNWDTDTPALVFNGGEKAAAETVSHEVGHSLFLGHDGRTNPAEEYYSGHGTGATAWGPIQGAPFGPSLSQWSKGEYASASNSEDDLNIITTRNGFGYRVDDAANNIGAATNINKLPAVGNRVGVDQKGLIEQRTDADFFRLNVGTGLVSLNINGAEVGSNLDILAEVYDSSGNLVATSNPTDLISATVSFTATIGAYYIKIDGVGMGDPLGIGYTDYGSLGQYRITGDYTNPDNSPPILNDQNLPAVREGSPVGTIVGTVLAQDPDEAQLLTYSIIAGNTGGAFAINPTTGRITVANTAALDWEVSQVFNLTVQVTDNGTPVRTDTGVVRIEVLDVTTFTLSGSILTVKGTHLNDQINVLSSGGTIKINDGLSQINTAISAASVTQVYLIGLAGNDSLRLDSTLGTAYVSTISGGLGDDSLISSLGQDTLDGGAGLDEASYVQAVSAVNVSLLIAGSQNTGGAGPDSLVAIENLAGSNFGDMLTGNAGNNALSGGLGNDTLNGGLGDDKLEGGQGADTLLGGEGSDLLIFDTADTTVSGAGGIDTAKLVNPTAAVNLSLLPGQIEIVDATASAYHNTLDATGATWNVTIRGGSGNDKITGGNLNDILEGGGGNDTVAGGPGADKLDGGHGDDTLKFDNLDTSVIGGPGKDTAVVTNATGAVNLNLAVGQIEIVDAKLSTFNNILNAADAVWNVSIYGGSGHDTIIGGKSVDVLFGGAGSDTISGGLGNDTIEGGAGADSLDGGGGNDTLSFDNLDTSVKGGAGTDTANAAGTTGAITLNLVTSTLETVNAASSIYANKFDATGANWIVTVTGGSGADTLWGGNLNDKLFGGAGSDSIIGNGGNDTLDGGAGIDTVSYATATSRVEVNLAQGRAVGGAGTDSLTGFENLTGSIFNDKLIGNSGSNIIRGGGGVDEIIGGGGTDSIIRS